MKKLLHKYGQILLGTKYTCALNKIFWLIHAKVVQGVIDISKSAKLHVDVYGYCLSTVLVQGYGI